MHLRLAARAFACIALFVFAIRLPGQTPATPAPGRDSVVPLITDAPVAEPESPSVIPAATKDPITATENAVLAAHDASIAAAEALDLDRLFSSLVPTNRGAMIARGHVTLTQDEVMESTRRDFADLTSLHYTYTRRHVTLLSLTSAIIVGEGTVTATTRDGATFSRPFAQTIVYMRVGESWKVIHLHASSPAATLGG